MALDFKIGEFREKLSIERQIAEQTTTGAVEKRWIPYKDVFGKVEILSTGESVSDGGRITNFTTYRITTYIDDKVDTSYRIIWRGDPFEIKSVEVFRFVYMYILIQG